MRLRFRLGGALARALLIYWVVLFPQARCELRRWSRQAAAIEEPILRDLALGKLNSEGLVAEGAAAFAILAARAHRADVVRAVVAYEVLYDVVDAVGELPTPDPLAHNRAVHAALLDALAPGAPMRFRPEPAADAQDACFLTTLVYGCREALRRLPAHPVVLPALERFAARAAEAQSLNHAGSRDGHRALARWAQAQQVPGSLWWEVAAAAGDPLGIFALVGAAGDPATDREGADAIEHAYFPWIGALVWLMESLVDQRDDAASGNHSYVGHYGCPHDAARRLGAIAARAGDVAEALPRGPSHTALLAGVVSLYLSDPRAGASEATEAARAIREALGWPVTVLLAVLRLRRRCAKPSRRLGQLAAARARGVQRDDVVPVLGRRRLGAQDAAADRERAVDA